jgi:hypothetical protein
MPMRSLAKTLPADPDNDGSVLGWAVVRTAPWELIGIYATKEVAEIEVDHRGSGYLVEYGSHRLGTDEFIGGLTPPK